MAKILLEKFLAGCCADRAGDVGDVIDLQIVHQRHGLGVLGFVAIAHGRHRHVPHRRHIPCWWRSTTNYN